ncbi:hypothetical protein AAW26_23690 [Vibrio alginolyticus]|nr:hypothetical protein AAW26_23690 [Vibrio alginolyticus]
MVGVSSTTFARSDSISATGATIKFTVWLTLSPLGSVAVKVNASEPFQSAVGLIVAMPFSIDTNTLLLPDTEHTLTER